MMLFGKTPVRVANGGRIGCVVDAKRFVGVHEAKEIWATGRGHVTVWCRMCANGGARFRSKFDWDAHRS